MSKCFINLFSLFGLVVVSLSFIHGAGSKELVTLLVVLVYFCDINQQVKMVT